MHRTKDLVVKDWSDGRSSSFRLCTGEEISISKGSDGFRVSYMGHEILVPCVSPLSGKEVVLVGHDTPHTIAFWYGSSWRECKMMTCARGVVLITPYGLSTLPNVNPETYVWPESQLSQLVIGRVEKTRFGTPCAAILDTGNITTNISQQYVFPKEEPIIIEGHAAVVKSGRVHSASNPGTGAMSGEVPFLHPWISPDNTRHGWALAFASEWEVIGKERPGEGERPSVKETRFVLFSDDGSTETSGEVTLTPAVIADREVFCDGLDSDDEFYTIYLGKEPLGFQMLNGTGKPQDYSRIKMRTRAHENRKCKEVTGRIQRSKCGCPDTRPRSGGLTLGWVSIEDL